MPNHIGTFLKDPQKRIQDYFKLVNEQRGQIRTVLEAHSKIYQRAPNVGYTSYRYKYLFDSVPSFLKL